MSKRFDDDRKKIKHVGKNGRIFEMSNLSGMRGIIQHHGSFNAPVLLFKNLRVNSIRKLVLGIVSFVIEMK